MSARECPFCGGVFLEPQMLTASAWYVQCWTCHSHGPVTYTEAEALAAWNRRADDPRVARLREAAAAIREIIGESRGVDGWHKNGALAEWHREFEAEVAALDEAIAAFSEEPK